MADLEITYNNSTIVSLSDSATEVLETNGTFMADDITVKYTKSSAVKTTHVESSSTTGGYTYVDGNGTAQSITLNPSTTLNADVIAKSLIVGYAKASNPAIGTPTNATLLLTLSIATTGTYKQVRIFQAN